jgi:hypothetical protein
MQKLMRLTTSWKKIEECIKMNEKIKCTQNEGKEVQYLTRVVSTNVHN